MLDQLSASDATERFAARRRVAEVDAGWLPAVLERFEQLADGSNKLALKALLEKVRDRARAELRAAMEREGKTGAVVTPDYLDMLVAHPDRSAPELRPLTEVVALSRMLESIGTLPAARGLINVYVRFGEFLRVDTQLALARLQDRAVAALIEATVHPVPRIAEWAGKQLSALDKAQPSSAMQVTDPSLRADILRAYGKTRDLDHARLLLSYAASERAQIRLAARQAVAMLGDAAIWQLRDAYEKTVGSRAPREWPWDRVARELFARYDSQRLAHIYAAFERGLQAERAGDLAAARAAFDEVLASDPSFERREVMAPVYLAFAQTQADNEAEAAALAARRAARLAPSGPVHDRAESLRYTLEARALLARGIADEVLVQRARELDPENQRAAALESELRAMTKQSHGGWRRYSAALVIAGLGVTALLVVAIKQRQARAARSVAAPATRA